MKHHRLLISLLAVSTAQHAFAQVPHQFEANTPAVAAEVNENFQHVVDAIDNVEAGVNTLESTQNTQAASIQAINTSITDLNNNVAGNDSDISDLQSEVNTLNGNTFTVLNKLQAGAHNSNYSYSAASANIGDEIPANGYEFRIVKIPFKDLGTGDNYTITYAQHCGTDCTGLNNISIIVTHVNANASGSMTIDGYPAHIHSQSYYTKIIQPERPSDHIRLSSTVSTMVNIRVNESLITLTYNVNSSTRTDSTETADFSANTDLINYSATLADTVKTYVDTAIDYIDIEPLP